MDPKLLLESCLKNVVELGGSDLHLKTDGVPRVRVSGRIKMLDMESIGAEDIKGIADCIMTDYHRDILRERKGVDLAFTSEDYGRYRANIFYQRSSLSIVIRTIKGVIPDFKELHLPDILEEISLKERGLILVGGATSSGKSTTVASIVDYINRHKDVHIVTIEDPIEYIHQDKRAIINQREVGEDTVSFEEALRSAVRQDPDIIVIGEMRDSESFNSAISASETGHLVISTIHAKNVGQIFERILGFFPSEQRDQILVQLSYNMQAVMCQRLLKRKDGMGVIPAVEILITNPSVAKLIAEGKLEKLNQAMVNGKEEGMQSFNMSLCKLYEEEYISKEEALIGSDNQHALKMNMKGIFLDDAGGGILER